MPAPFRAESYDLPVLATGQEPMTLTPVTPDEAAGLARQMASIPPWSTYGVNPGHLEGLFRGIAGGAATLALRRPGELAPLGVAVVRSPWLLGPYMQFLGLAPHVHGQGLGTRVLSWMQAEATSAGSRNIWICAAGFNEGAQRLYTRFGFKPVATLDDLIIDGVAEVLMRKRLQ
jgi:diamine N-acetyltransferase